MSGDEVAAVTAALAALSERHCQPQVLPAGESRRASRWKIASRNPDLEIEELRAVH